MLALGAALTLAGCVTQTVTLLPGEPGHPVGAVALLNADGSERGTLATPDQRAGLGRRGAVHAIIVADADVEKHYGRLIADLPPPAIPYTLSFDIGESTPAPDQEAVLKAILAEAAARSGAEVQVIGHTDRAGSTASNDALSRQRAIDVQAYLIGRGLRPEDVRATWRGEREPIEHTADGVRSPRNRRVEVIVR